MMTSKLDTLRTAVNGSVQGMADCDAIQRESVKAVWSGTNPKEMELVLMGSLLKFEPRGGTTFYATVATSGEVVSGTGERTKLAFSKSGGTGPISKMTITELTAAGLTQCILGIFSDAAGAGSNAGSVVVGGLPTTLTPVCTAANTTFDNIAISVGGGQRQDQLIETAVKTTRLRWRVFAGQTGGAGATPEGDGLRPIAESDATEIDDAWIQGTGMGAALIGAAVRTMGVTDGVSGKCTVKDFADFISSWVGIPQASAIVSTCIAERRDDTVARAAAKAGGRRSWRR